MNDAFDLLQELNEVHRLLVEDIKDDLQHEDVVVRRKARESALQLLKQNSISASAMPETPKAEMARMMGKIDGFTAIEEKLRVRTVLRASASPALGPGGLLAAAPEAHGDTVERVVFEPEA